MSLGNSKTPSAGDFFLFSYFPSYYTICYLFGKPTVNFHFLPQYIYKSVQAQHKLPTHSCWRVSPVPLDRVGWSSHCQCYSCQHKIAFRRHSTRVGWSTHKLAEWDLQHFLATVKLKWAAVYICKSTHNIYKNYIDDWCYLVILYGQGWFVGFLFIGWYKQACRLCRRSAGVDFAVGAQQGCHDLCSKT